jgi:AcrR family transcriptional regulator
LPKKSPVPQRSLDLLWGTNQRSARGPKPALSLHRIVQTAVDAADSDGLAPLTMSRVAAGLGVTTMALYRYVPGKDELVDLMIDAALGAPPPVTGRSWRSGLTRWAAAGFASFSRHPWLLEAMMTRVSVGPNWASWLDSALQTMSGLSLTASEKMAVVLLIDGHVRAAAQVSAGVTGSSDWAAAFSRVLHTIKTDERYPALNAIAAAGAFHKRSTGEQNAFEFGLERLLDGIESFTRARSRRRSGHSGNRRHS